MNLKCWVEKNVSCGLGLGSSANIINVWGCSTVFPTFSTKQWTKWNSGSDKAWWLKKQGSSFQGGGGRLLRGPEQL